MQRLPYLLFILSIVFLSFVAGGLIVMAKVFPYAFLRNAYLAGDALLEQTFADKKGPYWTDLWHAPRRASQAGVTVYRPERAYNGYTLYTSGHARKAFLIDMNGDVVHRWRLPYRAFWDESAAVDSPVPESQIFIMRAYVYPNGDLLAQYMGSGDTPWGYGLVKMNRDSQVIWKYMAHAHHDLDVGRDGRVYALTQEIRTDKVPDAAYLEPPRITDYVVVLSPDGRELKKISVLQALMESRYARLLAMLPWFTMRGAGDYLHTNGVSVIEGEAARNFPFAEAGDILVSLREINTIAVIDPDTEKVTWALRGPWIGQHDPDILTNGNILIFDNNGHFGPGGQSRVIEFDPVTLEIVWRYTGDAKHPFESVIRSGQQRLPNGNTLISESDGARIFEVTPDKRIVWEFINPARGGSEDQFIPVVSVAQRLGPAYFNDDFLPAAENAGGEAPETADTPVPSASLLSTDR